MVLVVVRWEELDETEAGRGGGGFGADFWTCLMDGWWESGITVAGTPAPVGATLAAGGADALDGPVVVCCRLGGGGGGVSCLWLCPWLASSDMFSRPILAGRTDGSKGAGFIFLCVWLEADDESRDE